MDQNHVKMLRAPGAEGIQDLLEIKPGICVLWGEDSEPEHFNLEDALAWTKEELRTDHGGGLIIPSVGDYMGMVDWDLIKCVPTLFKLDDRFIIVAGSWTFSGIAWVECWCLFVQHEVRGLSWDSNIWR